VVARGGNQRGGNSVCNMGDSLRSGSRMSGIAHARRFAISRKLDMPATACDVLSCDVHTTMPLIRLPLLRLSPILQTLLPPL
jgi:hypothetical protein